MKKDASEHKRFMRELNDAARLDAEDSHPLQSFTTLTARLFKRTSKRERLNVLAAAMKESDSKVLAELAVTEFFDWIMRGAPRGIDLAAEAKQHRKFLTALPKDVAARLRALAKLSPVEIKSSRIMAHSLVFGSRGPKLL